MKLVIIPDIFGRTPALERLCDRLDQQMTEHASKKGASPPDMPSDITIIDPYDGLFFEHEQKAYAYFTANTSIAGYSRLIRKQLKGQKEAVTLLGFSAGASAVWHMSGAPLPCPVIRSIGFYGSQIRHFPDIRPAMDTHLIFPDSEDHFDVDRLIKQIQATPRVTIEKIKARHGFMNAYSKGFDKRLYNTFIENRLPKLLMPAGY